MFKARTCPRGGSRGESELQTRPTDILTSNVLNGPSLCALPTHATDTLLPAKTIVQMPLQAVALYRTWLPHE